MRATVFGLMLILAVPGLGIGQEEGAQPSVVSAAVKDQLARLLPEPSEVAATATGERKYYSSDLYEYIDGGADIYLGYDLVAMVHQEYKVSSADVTLDIYNMGAQANAFGIYAAERSPDYHFLPIGTEGYGTNEILNFFQGEFYVKLSAFSDKEKTGPILEHFAQAVSQKLGPAGPMPAFLSLFPPPNLVSHSAKFVKKSPLGHDFLAPAILATYVFGAQQTTLAITKASGAEEALKKVSQLRGYYERSGKVVSQPELASGAFLGSNSSDGEAIFFASGPYVVLWMDPPPDRGAFLQTVIERLREKGTDLPF